MYLESFIPINPTHPPQTLPPDVTVVDVEDFIRGTLRGKWGGRVEDHERPRRESKLFRKWDIVSNETQYVSRSLEYYSITDDFHSKRHIEA